MPLQRPNLALTLALWGVLSAAHAQDGHQCVDPRNMSVRYQLSPCPSHLMYRPAWRSSENPSGWTTTPPATDALQPSAVSTQQGRPKTQNDLLNQGVSGAIGAAGVLLLLALFVWAARSLIRVCKGLAGQSAKIAALTSAEDLARAAGSVAGVAERKSRKLRDAFNQGRVNKNGD